MCIFLVGFAAISAYVQFNALKGVDVEENTSHMANKDSHEDNVDHVDNHDEQLQSNAQSSNIKPSNSGEHDNIGDIDDKILNKVPSNVQSNNIRGTNNGGHRDDKVPSKDDSKKAYLQLLQCNDFGGPSDEVASEMVYWWKIPSDEEFLNPFQKMHMQEEEEKYLLFEQDEAGWNNVR